MLSKIVHQKMTKFLTTNFSQLFPLIFLALPSILCMRLERRRAGEASSLISNPNCLLPRERGEKCGNGTAEMKWYFDSHSLRCLAFGFNGCGGNPNRFDSLPECHKQCELTLPSDYAHCAGGEEASARKANGRRIICAHSNSSLVEKCPHGFRCQMLFAYGICCDSRTYEIYARNYHPKCPSGEEPYKIFDEFNQMAHEVLGKNCHDEFCPPKLECHQQELFAYCCPGKRID